MIPSSLNAATESLHDAAGEAPASALERPTLPETHSLVKGLELRQFKLPARSAAIFSDMLALIRLGYSDHSVVGDAPIERNLSPSLSDFTCHLP